MGTAPRRGSPEQARLAPGRTRGLCQQGLLLRGLQGGGGPGTEQQSQRSARSPPPCPSLAPHTVTLPALDQGTKSPARVTDLPLLSLHGQRQLLRLPELRGDRDPDPKPAPHGLWLCRLRGRSGLRTFPPFCDRHSVGALPAASPYSPP